MGQDGALATGARLYVEQADVARVTALVDIHLSTRMTIDTHATPVQLSGLSARRLLHPPASLAHAAAARAVAELILSAPGMVGSLDLLFNVTGLVRGVGAGLADLFQLPLSGLSSASLSVFVSGVWSGWASLFSHLSGWTLTSVGGFSASVARLLKQVRLSPICRSGCHRCVCER